MTSMAFDASKIDFDSFEGDGSGSSLNRGVDF